MPKPLKRFKVLQPISRQHHKVLQCCFKIRKGLELGIEPKRIINYINYFFDDFYSTHQYNQQALITTLINNHSLNNTYKTAEVKITQLKKSLVTANDLLVFENALYKHARWEERTLFEWLQNNIGEGEITKATSLYPINEDWCELYSDNFWLAENS